MPYRVCSEPGCNNPLDGKDIKAKTCSPSCRQKRSRRLRKQKKEAGLAAAATPEQREIAERVRAERDDVAHKIIEQEVRPIVRESITEDTMRAIQDMVGLTPQAVRAIGEDLASEDATIRQRAYTLILKYTAGHPAIVRPPDEDKTQPLQVNFNLPRPPKEGEVGEDGEPTEVVETKECDMCEQHKPVDEFAANSDRCLNCYNEQRAKADELLEGAGGDSD